MSVESIVASGRRLIATSLLDRARIQDRVLTPDSTGGQKPTFVERSKTINCRFVSPKENEPTLNVDSVFGPTTMILMLPLGTIYREGDRVRNMQGGLYVITRDVAVPSDLAVIMRVGIREVD